MCVNFPIARACAGASCTVSGRRPIDGEAMRRACCSVKFVPCIWRQTEVFSNEKTRSFIFHTLLIKEV